MATKVNQDAQRDPHCYQQSRWGRTHRLQNPHSLTPAGGGLPRCGRKHCLILPGEFPVHRNEQCGERKVSTNAVVVHMHTYTHTHTRTRAHIHIHPYTDTYTHTYTRTHIRTPKHTCTHTYTHTHVHIHTCTQMDTHTHSLTHSLTESPNTQAGKLPLHTERDK